MIEAIPLRILEQGDAIPCTYYISKWDPFHRPVSPVANILAL